MSASGLPLPSVSNGTAGGILVPRRRTYCDAAAPGIRNVITRKVLPSTNDVTDVQGEAPPPLNVLRIAVEVFFAAGGTDARPVVEPSASIHAAFCGHAPA